MPQILKDATNFCDLFLKIIEWAGPVNFAHLVTNNVRNYVAAGRLIQERYCYIY